MSDANEQSDHPDQDRRKARPQTWRQRWAVTSLPNKLMVVATISIAIAAFVNLAVAVGQWIVLGRQLDEMAGASNYAERQAILAIGQLAVANRNASSAQQQAKAAQDNVQAIRQADQRSMIKFDMGGTFFINLVKPMDNPIIVVRSAPLFAKVTLTSVGKGVARQVVSRGFVEVVDSTKEPQFERLETDRQTPYTRERGPGLLFPGDQMKIGILRLRWKDRQANTTEQDILTGQEFDELVSGKAYLAVYGIVTHSDTLGIAHWTKFCQWFITSTIPGPIKASKCTRYNDADHN